MSFNKEIGKASVRITGDSKGLSKELKKAQTGVAKFKTSAMSAFKGVGVAGLALTAVTVALSKLARISKDAVGQLDTIGKTARRVGLSTTAFQEWSARAEAAGVSQETFNMSVQRFSRRIGEAKLGTGELIKSLKTLNIGMRDHNGNFKTTEVLLEEYADKVSKVSDENEQLALTTKAFDSEGAKMVEMLRQTEAEADAVISTFREYGGVIDESVILKAEQAATKLGLLEKANKAAAANMAVELLPLNQALADLKNNILQSVNNWAQLLNLVEAPLDKQVAAASNAYHNANIELAEMEKKLKFITDRGVTVPGLESKRSQVVELRKEYELLADQQVDLQKKLNDYKKAQEGSGGDGDGTGGTGGYDEAQLSAAEKIIEAQRERTAAIEETTRALDEMFFAGTISADEYDAAMEKVQKTTEKVGKTAREVAEEIEEDTIKVSELQKITNDAVDQLGNALSQAASDGTIDFENMFKSIIAGAIRAQLQVALIGKASEGGISGGGGLLGGIVKAAMPMAMSYFGGTAATYGTTRGSQQTTMLAAQDAGFRAGGGRVYAGQSYNVGELRAERFTPDSNGTIDPHPGNGGTAGNNIKVVVNNSGEPKNAKVSQKQIGKEVIVNVLLEDFEQGGKISKHMGSTFGVTRKA